jgi:Ferritin-like domain
MGGGAVLSALAPSAFASSGTGRPPASFGKGDVGILNYALTLEYLEGAFYNGATAANLPLSSQAAAFLKIVTADENAHVAFLKKHLGHSAAKQPKFDFKGTNTNAEMFMKTAQVLENTGVHAYSGQALNIKTPAYVKATFCSPDLGGLIPALVMADERDVRTRARTSLGRLVLRALAAGLSLAALIAVAAILTHSFDATDGRLIVTSLSFSFFTALGGAGVGARQMTGPIRNLGSATLLAAGVSFVLLMMGLWSEAAEGEFWRAWAILVLLTLAASHACLVLTSRRRSDPPLIVALTATSVVASSFDAMLGALAISGLADHVDGNFVRLLTVLVIVMLLTTVLPPILRRIPSRERSHATGLPVSPVPASMPPLDEEAEDLLAIACRLEALAPSTGELARAITREAAHLRSLAQNPGR